MPDFQRTPQFVERVLSLLPNQVYVFDVAEQQVIYTNESHQPTLPGFTELSGVPRGNLWSTLHPDDRERVQQAFQAIIDTGATQRDIEYRVQRSNGDYMWVLGSMAALEQGDDGRVTQIIGTSVNIGERKQAEDIARQTFEKIRYQANLLENVSDAVVSTDKYFKIVSWNKAAEVLYGWCDNEVMGKSFDEIMLRHYMNGITEEHVEQIFLESGQWEGEVMQQRRDSTWVQVWSSVTMLRDSEGHFSGALAVNRDISERKKAEEALLRQAKRLQVLSQIERSILADESPEKMYATVLRHTRHLLDADRVSIMIFDEEAQQGNIFANDTDPDFSINLPRITPLPNNLDTLKEGGILVFGDISELLNPDMMARALIEKGIRSMMNATLVVQGQVIGSLNVSSRVPNAFTDEHIEIVREITNQLAIAIQQARMTEQLRIYNASLEEQVAQRSAELNFLINSIPDHIYVLDQASNQIQLCNTVFAQGVGYANPDEVCGRHLSDLLEAQDIERSLRQNEQVWTTGATVHEQEIAHLLDGPHHFDTYKVPMRKPDGTIYALISTSRDITPIVNLQEQLTERTVELEALMNTLPDKIWMVGRDLRHFYGNDSFAESLKLNDRSEIVGKSYEELFDPATALAYEQEDRNIFATGRPVHKQETAYVQGDLRHFDTYIIPLKKPDGTVYALLGTSRDITALIKLQDQLAERTAELEALMNSVPDLIWIMGRNETHLYCNDGFAAAMGLEHRSYIVGKSHSKLFGEEAAAAFAAEDRQVFESGEALHKQETVPIHGEMRHFDTYKIPLKKPDGSVYALIGTTRDITPIIELQRELSQRTIELETLMNTLPDQIWMVDAETGAYMYCNDEFAQNHHNGDRVGIAGKTALDVYGAEKGAGYMADNRRVFDTGAVIHLQQQSLVRDETHYYDTYKMPIRRPDGTIYALLGTSRDITPIVRLQEELAERTTILEGLMNNIPDHVWVVDTEHRFLYANKQYIENIGPADKGRSIAELYPERTTLEITFSQNNQVFTAGETLHTRSHLKIDDEWRWFDTYKIPLYKPDGTVYALLGTARDITPIVRLQEELAERTTILEGLMNAIPDYVWVIDREQRFMYANQPYIENVGPADKGRSVAEMYQQRADIQLSLTENEHILSSGTVLHEPMQMTIKGSEHWLDLYKIPLKRADGTVYALLGTARDITPTMQLQNELRKRTIELEGLMNAIPDYIWVTEKVGDQFVYRYGNETFARGLGLEDRTQATGKTPYDFYAPEEAAKFIQEDEIVFATGEPLHKQDEGTLADGHRFFDTYLIPLKQPDGEVYAVIGTARDITPIVRLQEQLVERTAELESLIDTVPDYIWIMDATTREFIYANTGFLREAKLPDLRNILNKTLADVFPAEVAQNYLKITQEVIENGETLHKVDTSHLLGGTNTLDEYIIPVKTPDGRVTKIIGTARDITPLIELQQRLTERTVELEGVMNAVPDYIWIHSRAEQAYTYCNDNFARATGHERAQDVIGKTEADLFPEADSSRYAAENLRVLTTGETIHKQEENVLATGKRTLDIYLVPLRRPDGTIHGLVGTARDITTLIELQRALSERTAELETLINTIPDHIWVIERGTHNFLYANENYTQYIGLRHNSDVHGRTKADFYPQEVAERFHAEDDDVFEKSAVYHEQEVTWREGKPQYYDTYKLPLHRPDGTVYALLGTARNITETIQLQQQLSQRTAELEALMHAVPDHIWMIGPGGDHYLYANASYARDLKLPSPEAIRGRKLIELHTPEEAERYVTSNIDLFKHGHVTHFQQTTDRFGDTRTFDIFLVPLFKPDNTVYALLGIARDITSIIDLQNQLLERSAALEVTNNEIEAFAYSVSHDLRTPLRSINGFSRALLQSHADCLDATGHMLLQRVYDASVRMTTLIEDLLRLAELTRHELRREPVDLSAMATGILNDLAQADPNRTVEVVVADNLRVTGDDNLLRVALTNLLENAWKFTGKTPNARIEVGLSADQTFFVRDNGAGFDMTYADRLFRAFHRLHSANEFPGTGIGLATVERIIQRHGGRIWAESQVDAGTTFYFSI